MGNWDFGKKVRMIITLRALMIHWETTKINDVSLTFLLLPPFSSKQDLRFLLKALVRSWCSLEWFGILSWNLRPWYLIQRTSILLYQQGLSVQLFVTLGEKVLSCSKTSAIVVFSLLEKCFYFWPIFWKPSQDTNLLNVTLYPDLIQVDIHEWVFFFPKQVILKPRF